MMMQVRPLLRQMSLYAYYTDTFARGGHTRENISCGLGATPSLLLLLLLLLLARQVLRIHITGRPGSSVGNLVTF